MRATSGQSWLRYRNPGHRNPGDRRQAASRVVALAAGAGLVGVMAVSGVAPASASSASVSALGRPAAWPGSRLAWRAAGAGPLTGSWSAYLNGPLHTSYSRSQTAITPGNATTLVQKWGQTLGAPYIASPTVVGGSVYIGTARGWFYRLGAHTGKVLAKIYIGRQPTLTCPAMGVSATATVARDPRTHALTVYVAGGNGYLYALRATTLTRVWRSVIAIPSKKISNFYNWSSPTVSHGKIYIGVSSNCDQPLIRGGVLAFGQATGARLAEFYTVPAGRKNAGGSVWSSIGVAPNGDVYATTGNGPADEPRLAASESVLKLDPNTLALLGSFKVPKAQVSQDGDFGGSPVFFDSYVGACNKNGYFYALQQSTMKLAWKRRIGYASGGPKRGSCLASPVYNGKDLYFGGNQTKLGGVTYAGSIEERSPATGALIWATGLPGGVMGSPTMDGAGVIAVGTYGATTTGIYLVNAANGALLSDPLMAGDTFGQSVFAEGQLFCANITGVYAWDPPTS
jgi:outer membrane protein assembly factor BamB